MSGFPSSLGYYVSKLDNYAKQSVKFFSDRGTTAIQHGDTIKFDLPKNSMVDLGSLALFFKGTCNSVGSNTEHQGRFFPRLSASIIQSISIYTNGGTLIQTIDDYNLIYAILNDWTGGNKDTSILENGDPSMKSSMDVTTGAITPYKTKDYQAADISDTNRQFLVNTWIGFLNSTSLFQDTNNMELTIEIRLAPAHILFNSVAPNTGAVAAPSTATYTLNDVYMTIDRITFHDPTYYNIISSKLMSSGLDIGYDSFTLRSGAVATDKAVSMSTTVNARCLSMLICTGVRTDRSDMTPANNILMNDENSFSSSVAAGNVGFNNSKYFSREGKGILTSQIDVNSVATCPYPQNMSEIFNQNLVNFNINSTPHTHLHKGIQSVWHFSRNYFFHSVSFEHRGSDKALQSGLDGKASSIDIKWQTTSTAGCGDFIPYIIAVKKDMLKVLPGHMTQFDR
jgi:hypothetical protein